MGTLVEIDYCLECNELKIFKNEDDCSMSYRWHCSKADKNVIKRLKWNTKHPPIPEWCPKLPKNIMRFSTTRDLVFKYALNSTNKGFEKQKANMIHSLRLLKKRISLANQFIKSAKKDLEAKELNKETFLAETAVAYVAIDLYNSLQKMVGIALKKSDRYCIIFLSVATQILSRRLETDIKQKGMYPSNDRELWRKIVLERKHAASVLNKVILRELGDVPERLGVELRRRIA